jgi:inositol transport system substrate-binding protein
MRPVSRRLHAPALVLALVLALAVAGCGDGVVPVIPLIPLAPSASPARPPSPVSGSGIVIGASFPALDPFLTALADALQAHAAALGDVDVRLVSAQGPGDTQIEDVQAFVDQGVDAVIVVADDTDATAPITELVRGAGIPLVYLNRRPADLPFDGSIPYVGSDSLAAGTMEMSALADRAGEHGDVALLIGDPANEAAVRRTEGAKDVIVEHHAMRLVREAAAGWDRARAHDVVQGWLTAGDTFDLVCANDDEMALGAIDALREADLLSLTIVGGVDGTADGLAAIGSGDLDVTVFQDAAAQGAGAIDAAMDLVGGRSVATDDGVVDVPQALVTRENVGEYLSRP